MSPIIEVAELLKIYRNPDVLIFDASNGNSARANYESEHLEGAFFVDLNTQLADIKSDLSKEGLLKQGDLVINMASIPIEENGKSNMLKLSYVE